MTALRAARPPQRLCAGAAGIIAVAAAALVLVMAPARAAARPARAVPAARAARAARRDVRALQNPRYSLAIAQYLWPACTGASDYTPGCLRASLAMLNAGRRSEGLGPVMLPANWATLTVAQQLFVLTELERTARGLPAYRGLVAALDVAAQAGADAGRDPSAGGAGVPPLESVWAGGEPNAIVVMADWVYADGIFPDGASENLGCSLHDRAGCWSHRDIILRAAGATACGSRCVIGAGFSHVGHAAGGGGYGRQSFAEVLGIGAAPGREPLAFSWAAERGQLPPCERHGDSCRWAGIPTASAGGIHEQRGGALATRPWFPVGVRSRLGRLGRLTVRVEASVRLAGLGAVATLLGADHRLRVRRLLRVRRTGAYRFTLTGVLRPGRWSVRIRYRMSRRRGFRPQSVLAVDVPSAR